MRTKFPTKVCLGQYEDGGTVKRLAEACGAKLFLEIETFIRTGMRATHHGSEPGCIQKQYTFAHTGFACETPNPSQRSTVVQAAYMTPAASGLRHNLKTYAYGQAHG